MFDANLKYLPKGERFVAFVQSVGKCGELAIHGVKRHDYVTGVVTRSADKDGENAAVLLDINGLRVALKDEFALHDDFLIFECRIPSAPEMVTAAEHPLNKSKYTRYR